MKRLLLAAFAVGLFAMTGCAEISAVAPGSSNAAATTDLDAGKALAASANALDLAVDSAEVAHQDGVLVGANWTKAKDLIQQADNVLQLARTAYTAGSSTDVITQLDALAGLVTQLGGLTGGKTAPAS